jgi:hypothetical protein
MANTAMTRRQRLLAALRREPVDQVPGNIPEENFVALVTAATQS